MLERGLNEFAIQFYISEIIQMTNHVLLLPMDSYDLSLDGVLQHLMQGGGDSIGIVDPGASQKTRIRRTDVHHIESGVKYLSSHLDWDVHLPMDHPLRSIKSSHHYIAGF